MTVACAIALALGMTSCSAIGMVGSVYTDFTVPTAVTSNALGTKVGQAEAISVLGVVAIGDAGIDKAAKQAGITKISHVDSYTKSYFGGIVMKQTIKVYGE